MKASVITIGCKLNQAESEYIKGYLYKKGYEIVDLNGDPDLCIINTCTVTHKADRSSVAMIRKVKRKIPNAKIIVTGCMVKTKAEVISRIGGVEILPFEKRTYIMDDFPFSSRKRIFIKVQDGCDRKCSYCVVSRIRDRLYSKPIEEIKKEIDYAKNKGFAEVVIVGLNIGLWGKEHGERFTTLLKMLAEIDYPRIRLTSIEPDILTDDMLRILADSHICRYLHIPVQHADDKILKEMGRKYSKKELFLLFEKITKYLPCWNIGADVIVGFPGENEKQFEDLCHAIEDSPITHLHVFSYSDRPGVPSTDIYPKVSFQTIKERNLVLRDIGERKSFQYRKTFKGKILQAVDVGTQRALTDNYIHVFIPKTGKGIFPVRITEVSLKNTKGELVDS